MKLYWRCKEGDGRWTYRPVSEQLADKVRKMGYGPQDVRPRSKRNIEQKIIKAVVRVFDEEE